MKRTKIGKITDFVLDFKITRLLLAFKYNGYLVQTGWLKSYKNRNPVNAQGEPVPWMTYSFIKFAESYFTKEMALFEYGAGNSTLFYSSRVDIVDTVETNKLWHKKLSGNIPSNVRLRFCEKDEKYEKMIHSFNKKYDVIVVDGIRRNECIEQALRAVKPDGIIILDDSERIEYAKGVLLLSSKGFKRLDFWGISPGYFHDKSTSIFSRQLKI